MQFPSARRFAVVPLVLLAAAASPGARADDAPVVFAAHRAVYEMSLGARPDRSEVAAVAGRFVYEFSGSRCEGWSSRFRLVTRVDTGEGRSRLTDLATTSFEEGDGRAFDFLIVNRVDGREVEASKGRAVRDASAIRIHLDRPASGDVELPAAVKFPTEHLEEIVRAAEAGRRIVQIDLYDGSENGAKSYRTTVVVGPEQTGPDDTSDEPAAASDLTRGHRRWPIDISFFDVAKPSSGDALPDYQISLLLYDDGVSRRMRLDYGAFSLKGTLSSLAPLPAAPCP